MLQLITPRQTPPIDSQFSEHSPNVKAGDKSLLEKFLNGRVYSYRKKITVAASSISCKASTRMRSDLSEKITTHGRKAHELYATLAEAGVPSDGAAGSIFEGPIKLSTAQSIL